MTMQDEFDSKVTVEGFTVRDGTRRAATLVLTEAGIRQAQGEGKLIPWTSAGLKKDDADGAVLVTGKGQVLGSTDPLFLRVLEGAAGNDLDRQLAKLQGLATGWARSQTIGCFLFFGLLLFGAISGPGCYRSAVDQAVEKMPYEKADEPLGEAAQESIEVGPEIDDEEVTAAIQTMVDRLAPHFEGTDVDPGIVTWKVRVVKSDVPNAFALPGGYITVFDQLIRDADSADMVAGVIGHEMAHVLQRHGLKRIANKIGLYAGMTVIFGQSSGIVGIAGELGSVVTERYYDRGQESEADVFGTEAMVQAGLDPDALGRFFTFLSNKYPDSQLPPGMQFLSSHPGHDTRTSMIAEMVKDLEVPEPRPLDIDWVDIKERVSADAGTGIAETPDEDSDSPGGNK